MVGEALREVLTLAHGRNLVVMSIVRIVHCLVVPEYTCFGRNSRSSSMTLRAYPSIGHCDAQTTATYRRYATPDPHARTIPRGSDARAHKLLFSGANGDRSCDGHWNEPASIHYSEQSTAFELFLHVHATVGWASDDEATRQVYTGFDVTSPSYRRLPLSNDTIQNRSVISWFSQRRTETDAASKRADAQTDV